ncbi:MAG: hypothetical protein EAX96_18975 [Candidatus Lokiarchaeota archaeon]|nr:hypothetical protein [Candidatus Lokiarchaeota archaeon]
MALNPIELVGYGIVIFVLVEVIVLTIKLFNDYKKTKSIMVLNFTLVFLSLISSIVLLILEKITLSIIVNYELSTIFAWLARIGVSMAFIFIAIISFDLTYPEKKKTLIIPIIIFFVIFLIYNYFVIFSGYPYTYIQEAEFVHDPIVLITLYVMLIPVSNISTVVFFYFSIVNRENPTASRRSFWMGFSILLFIIAYLFEIAPIAVIISVPMRALYIVSASILYYTFTKTPKD